VVAERNNTTPDQIPVSPLRSRNMAAIKGRDTAPELAVRKILHRLGYRFRLHRRDLPGTPDIVLP
jgi:DNA mismatch endonuclease (patch repair protein)